MRRIFLALALAASFCTVAVVTASAQEDCLAVNAAGSAGYVNVREWPNLNAHIVTRWNNPSHGSDWGSAYWCGEEYWDGERTWSYIQFLNQDGQWIGGWVSDKVLQFL